MGMAIRPKLIVPLQTGLGIPTRYCGAHRSVSFVVVVSEASTARATRSVPKAVRMARYSRPVAAITAEYSRSRRAALVTTTRPIVVTAQAAQNQPSVPPQPSSTAPVQHAEHAGRQQQGDDLDRPHPAEGVDELVEQAARQAGLDEVPVAEQHGVGHRAEEGGAGERAQRSTRPGCRRRRGRRRRARRRRSQPARGRAPAGTRGRAGARRCRRRSPARCPVIAATRAVRRSCSARCPADPGPAADDRHDEAEQARRGDAERRHLADRHGAERHPGGERAEGHQEVDPAQQPAVAEPDLAPPRREPAERHPARPPTAAAPWRRRGGSRRRRVPPPPSVLCVSDRGMPRGALDGTGRGVDAAGRAYAGARHARLARRATHRFARRVLPSPSRPLTSCSGLLHRRAPDARRERRRRPATRPSTPCSAASTPPATATFTADYDVLTRFGDLAHPGHGRAGRPADAGRSRSATVRFIFDGRDDGDVRARHRWLQRHDRRRA